MSLRDCLLVSVTHPGPGSLLPSIAGVVASFDPYATQYVAEARAQTSREEMVSFYSHHPRLLHRMTNHRHDSVDSRSRGDRLQADQELWQ